MGGYHCKSPVKAIIKRVNKDSIKEYIVFFMSRYRVIGNFAQAVFVNSQE